MSLEALLDEKDVLLVEEEMSADALAAAHARDCALLGVKTDRHGIIPESIDDIFRAHVEARLPLPKLLVTMPTARDPTGTTLPLERKRRIYDIALKHNLLIIEYDPYYYIGHEHGNASFLSLDSHGIVLRVDSLSNVLAPGLRLGWLTGPKPLIERINLHMQSGELCTSHVS
jgi:kynurenine/2-aminoadipate aminotransferase